MRGSGSVRLLGLMFCASYISACSEKLNVGWNELVDVSPMPSTEPGPGSSEPSVEQPPSPPVETAPEDAAPPPDAGSTAPTIDGSAPAPVVDGSVTPPPPDGGAESPVTEAEAAVPRDIFELPFDPAARVIVNNDGPFDNWQGEFAVLSVPEGLRLVGLVINSSWAWPDLDSNLAGWQDLVAAARASGIDGIPDPLRSDGPPLQRPGTGNIQETTPNRSAGAQFIVDTVNSLAADEPPLVVVTGGRLTDVADAYLIDPTIADRMVVLSSLGELTDEGARMSLPNGELDAWADTIVATRLHYIQVSAYYVQQDDLPPERIPELPATALGDWMAAKEPRIHPDIVAADQVALLAAMTTGFVRQITPVRAQELMPFNSGEGPTLVRDEAGSGRLVTEIDGALATERFWQLLDAAP